MLSNLPKVTELIRINVKLFLFGDLDRAEVGKGRSRLFREQLRKRKRPQRPPGAPNPSAPRTVLRGFLGFARVKCAGRTLPRYGLDLGSGLVSWPARGCSNGAGATRRAGRG